MKRHLRTYVYIRDKEETIRLEKETRNLAGESRGHLENNQGAWREKAAEKNGRDQ
jgi:hypothetical protein